MTSPLDMLFPLSPALLPAPQQAWVLLSSALKAADERSGMLLALLKGKPEKSTSLLQRGGDESGKQSLSHQVKEQSYDPSCFLSCCWYRLGLDCMDHHWWIGGVAGRSGGAGEWFWYPG